MYGPFYQDEIDHYKSKLTLDGAKKMYEATGAVCK